MEIRAAGSHVVNFMVQVLDTVVRKSHQEHIYVCPKS